MTDPGITDEGRKARRKAGPNDGRRTSKNMGRPLGARDRFPRQSKAYIRGGVEERSRELETALGRAYAKINDLEHQLGLQPFPGDALELLRATQRGEYFPSMMQFHAAKVIFENQLDQRRVELDGHRAELEEQARQYHDGDATLDKLIADFGAFTADREGELQALVQAGDVTPRGAQAIRSWFVRAEPLALPPPQPAQAREAPTPASPAPDASPAPTPPGDAPAAAFDPEPAQPAEIARVIWAPRPFACYQTASGKRFEANSAAEVEIDDADPDDVKDLLRAGCRERR